MIVIFMVIVNGVAVIGVTLLVVEADLLWRCLRCEPGRIVLLWMWRLGVNVVMLNLQENVVGLRGVFVRHGGGSSSNEGRGDDDG